MLKSERRETSRIAVRLSFPKGEHADVLVAPGETTIGAAADNVVVVAAAGVAAHHASIVADPRGFTLFIHDPAARTHVNARPVREKAILRLGDVVSVDSVNLVLKPDSDAAIEPAPAAGGGPDAAEAQNETRFRVSPSRAVLRGVSGPYFGKVVPVHGRIEIGRGAECGLVLDEPEMSRRHALIEVTPNEIYLRDLGSANGTFVNGVQVRDAVLYPGDQIAFDRNRFLIEAPGMPVRRPEPRTPVSTPAVEPRAPHLITQTLRAVRADEIPAAAPPPAASGPEASGWNPWALLAAAVLIAGAFALLIFGFR
jgi:pSer/pThr/pTyr-binding forkhead associated (FHA) protein